MNGVRLHMSAEQENVGYSIRYIPSGLLRAADFECCIEYADERGKLHFFGFEPSHESGGILYFPSRSEWIRCHPNRAGQRDHIKQRLISYIRGDQWIQALERSLVDDELLERFPGHSDILGKNWRPRPPRSAIAIAATWVALAPLIGAFWLLASSRIPVRPWAFAALVLVAIAAILYVATQ